MSSKTPIMIAISGKSGCGNSTVSRIVAEELNLKLVNYTFHDMAKQMNITFEKLCELAEEDSKYDLKLDETQLRMASEAERCVLGSRLAVWLLKESAPKIYLAATPKVRSARISAREGGDLGETLEKTTAKNKRDKQRYLNLYHIDIDKYDFVDLVIDANELDQFQIAHRIIDFCGRY